MSVVQHQARLLTALQTRDLSEFSRLLRDSPDASCLEVACRDSDCVEFVKLLLEHGVDPNTLNPALQQTPLHVAAELGHYNILEVLLNDNRTDVNSVNGSEQTALHIVARNGKDDPPRFQRCMCLLLSHNIDVNMADWLGNTALHYADQESTLLLLTHGAFLGARNHSGDIPIKNIEYETLETFFNTCISLKEDGTLIFNYLSLVPTRNLGSSFLKDDFLSPEAIMVLDSPNPEMDPIREISRSLKLQQLMIHPLLSSFISIKWQRARKFYYASLCFYYIFVIVLTLVILERYLPRKGDSFCNSSGVSCIWKILGHIFLAICCVCEVVKMLFSLCMSPIKYFHEQNNYFQFLLTVCAWIIFFNESGGVLNTITLFIAWLRIFLLTGEHPNLSLYLFVFKKICCCFLALIAWTLLLLVGFSLSFYTMFHEAKTYIPEKGVSYKLFENPLSSLFTTVGMFKGGFETMFYPFEFCTGLSHVVFLLFCFLLSIVLTNVLTSIAVGNVYSAIKKFELIRILSIAKVAYDVETLVLGNPLYVHLRMRRLKLSHSRVMTFMVRSITYLWLSCNWLRYWKGLEATVVLYPLRSIEAGKNSKIAFEEEILDRATKVAKGRHVLKRKEARLSDIESALKRTAEIQQEILQLLQDRGSD